jgi:rod shape-determining protein MreC
VAADAFSPIRGGIDDIIEPVGSFLAGSVHYGAVRQQNQKLQDELDQLRTQQVSQQEVLQQMKQLTALLHLPFLQNLQTVPAVVTDFGTSDFASTIDISVGRDQGVQLNMPVVGTSGAAGQGGLVGQVVEANHDSATVRLITDGQSAVGVRYGSSANSLAVLTGQGSGKALSADLVPSNTPLVDGDVFYTSGLPGASYPTGIPVARVVAHRNGLTSAQETVSLEPEADLVHLRYVSVILWGPSA